MFDCDNFLDILGEISDDVITDTIIVRKKRNGNTIKIFTVFAAVFIFIICGILIRHGFTETDYTVPSEESLLPDNYDITTECFTENTSEEYTSETFSTEKETVSAENSGVVTPAEIPSAEDENTSAVIDEPTTQENIQGELQNITDNIVFNNTNAVNLISVSSDSLPDGYPISEKTDFYTLEKIYGTKILPSYLPSLKADSLLSNTVEDKYTVFYSEDKSSVYCDNTFRFILKNGSILSIHSSNNRIPLVTAETEDVITSFINNIPVLIFKSSDNGVISLFSAYLCKDGCYFRIQMSGIAAAQDEFIKIISSLIEKPES